MYGLRVRKRTMEEVKEDSGSEVSESSGNEEGVSRLEDEFEEDDSKDSWFELKKSGGLKRVKASNRDKINSEPQDEPEEKPFISEYERIRLQNIAERDQLLRSMGINVGERSTSSSAPVKKTRELKRVKKEKENTPMRMSMRLRSKPAEEPFADESISKDPEPDIDTRNLGCERWAEAELEGRERLLDDLKQKLNQTDFSYDGLDLTSCSIDCLQTVMHSLVVTDTPRVLNTRIQSLCVHPSVSKTIVFAGSKSGALGIWAGEEEEKDGCVELEPCRGPINCISVDDYCPSQLYLTSHDGTFTAAHIDTKQFLNIYATPYEDRINHITWHYQMDANNFLIGHGDGHVLMVDRREKKDSHKMKLKCFERSVRTVQVHPTQDKYFLASSGALGSGCAVFDLRSKKSVFKLHHDKGLTSSFFSSSGGSILTTCNDDTVKIFDSTSLDDIKLTKSVCHNNHTGRWLSVFKAQWYPGRDDVFHIGSLLNPRRVQMYSDEGKLLVEVRSDEVMSTVQPVIAVHQTRPFLVGGNSSGRLHIFAPPNS